MCAERKLETDVLIVGSGAVGVAAGIEAREASDTVLDSLVEEFHPQTTFEVDDQGRIVVVMDSASVERSFARLNS